MHVDKGMKGPGRRVADKVCTEKKVFFYMYNEFFVNERKLSQWENDQMGDHFLAAYLLSPDMAYNL